MKMMSAKVPTPVSHLLRKRKGELGRGRPSLMDLPGEDYTYGAESRPDEVGVGGCK